MTIWAVGRNYADHAKELGNTVPKEPLIFIKSEHCICQQEEVLLPRDDLHYELEIAVEVQKNTASQKLELHKMGFALDLTDREAQGEAKKKGLPWTSAKSFKNSCPLGPLTPIPSNTGISQLEGSLEFQLEGNGQTLQIGHSQNMVFSFSQILKHLQEHFPISCGDLILTGTPAGVGPVQKDQTLKARQINTDSPFLSTAQWKFV